MHTLLPSTTDGLLRAVAVAFPSGSINVFDQDLRYVLAAGAGLEAAGLTPEMLIGRTLYELYTPDAVAIVEPFYRRALAGESVRTELPVFGRVYNISAGPLPGGFMVAVAQDITASKETEHALTRSESELRLAVERLERESDRKDHFLATMAHELRQPLQACIAAVEVMRAVQSSASGERAREIVARQVQQMSRMVDDLLDASRVSKAQLTLDRHPVDIGRVLQNAVETVRGGDPAPDRFVTIAPTETVIVPADARRLEQVLVNLLTNAARHTPHDGRVTLTASLSDGGALVSVRDTGSGIEPHDVAQIFDLFNRGSRPSGYGLGIGLTLVKGIIEQHGGSIEVFSDGHGHGTEFVIRLPAAG